MHIVCSELYLLYYDQYFVLLLLRLSTQEYPRILVHLSMYLGFWFISNVYVGAEQQLHVLDKI